MRDLTTDSLLLSKIDCGIFSPASSPNYSMQLVRTAWIDESAQGSDLPLELSLLPHLPGLTFIRHSWNPETDKQTSLAQFFEKIEVVIILKHAVRSNFVLSAAAAMGRAVITDNENQTLINHGESGLVVKSARDMIAQAAVYLQPAVELRRIFGENLRKKFLEQQRIGN